MNSSPPAEKKRGVPVVKGDKEPRLAKQMSNLQTPAKPGIQPRSAELDSRFRGNDGNLGQIPSHPRRANGKKIVN